MIEKINSVAKAIRDIRQATPAHGRDQYFMISTSYEITSSNIFLLQE
jgi:hypothetical protein